LITVPDDRAERRHDALWAALTSCAANLLIWSGVIWLANAHIAYPQPRDQETELVLSSTAVVIEHRKPVPRPRSVSAPAQQPITPQHAQMQQRTKPEPTVASLPHELAREVPQATPQPRASARPHQSQSSLFAQTLARQEQEFAREAEQLHAQNNPISIATISPEQASAMRKSYHDIPGASMREGAQAILTPYKHWYDGDASCYYVRYDAEFSGGGSEQGFIPWPVCYPRTADRMLPYDRAHALPIPYPPPGFALRAGTYLTPLLRSIYERDRSNPQSDN
jgi:hypothetical protein